MVEDMLFGIMRTKKSSAWRALEGRLAEVTRK